MQRTEAAVELHLAFCWDCPSCGRENFTRGLVPEMSADELAELQEEHGVEAWESGGFVARPVRVTCHECQASFGTQDIWDGDE